MRVLFLLPLALLLGLSGCEQAAVAVGSLDVVGVTLMGRSAVDVGLSTVTGKDCSVVRLDKGQTYCAPREHLPGAPPFCTNTLGTVQCWANPEAFAVLPHQLADAPALNADQVRDVNARWPKSINLGD